MLETTRNFGSSFPFEPAYVYSGELDQGRDFVEKVLIFTETCVLALRFGL
jgi:hypothetical protein